MAPSASAKGKGKAVIPPTAEVIAIDDSSSASETESETEYYAKGAASSLVQKSAKATDVVPAKPAARRCSPQVTNTALTAKTVIDIDEEDDAANLAAAIAASLAEPQPQREVSQSNAVSASAIREGPSLVALSRAQMEKERLERQRKRQLESSPRDAGAEASKRPRINGHYSMSSEFDLKPDPRRATGLRGKYWEAEIRPTSSTYHPNTEGALHPSDFIESVRGLASPVDSV